MPRVPTYESAVAPAETTSERFQTPGALREAGVIGAGLKQLGAALGSAANTVDAIEKQRAETDFRAADTQFVDFANTIRTDPQTGILNLRGRAAVDAYAPATEALRKQATEIEAKLKSPQARRLFNQSVAQRRSAYGAEMATHVAREAMADADQVFRANVEANVSDGIASFQDESVAGLAVERITQEYAAHAHRHGLAPEVGLADARQEVSRLRLGAAQRWAEQNAAAAKAYADRYRGQMTGPDQAVADRAVRIAEDREQAEQRRAVAEAQAAQAHAVAVRREELATYKATLADGAGSSADWERLSDGYRAIGDTSSAQEATNQAGQVRASERYRSATLPQMDSRIFELEAKPSLTPSEAAELNGIKDRRASTAARLSQPGGALAQLQLATGRPLAPLDGRDPASYRARATQAIAAARTYGRNLVEPLQPSEAQMLKDMVAGDSGKRLAALQAVAKFGDPRAIDGAARQISDQNDGAFRVAATLMTLPGDAGYQAARDILRGPEAAKTNAAAFLPREARAVFTQYAGPALRGLAPDYAADVLDAARNLYFARVTSAGGTQWNEAAWRGAIDTALGGYRKDGVMYGGVASFRGVSVSIPPGWTGDGVFRRLARATGPELSAAAVGGAPVWPDGAAVYSGQLRELVPVRFGGTRYGFLTRNGRLLGSSRGGPYQLDVAKVPWR